MFILSGFIDREPEQPECLVVTDGLGVVLYKPPAPVQEG